MDWLVFKFLHILSLIGTVVICSVVFEGPIVFVFHRFLQVLFAVVNLVKQVLLVVLLL